MEDADEGSDDVVGVGVGVEIAAGDVAPDEGYEGDVDERGGALDEADGAASLKARFSLFNPKSSSCETCVWLERSPLAVHADMRRGRLHANRSIDGGTMRFTHGFDAFGSLSSQSSECFSNARRTSWLRVRTPVLAKSCWRAPFTPLSDN